MLRLGVGWLKGIITRQVQARTRHLYDFRVFLDSDGSTRSVELPLAKYSVDDASAEGSWALLMRCEGAPGTDEEEEGAGGGDVLGNGGKESGEDGGGGEGGTGVPEADSEEEEREEDGGKGGSTNRNEMRGGGGCREGRAG